jgi:hypothetical protein
VAKDKSKRRQRLLLGDDHQPTREGLRKLLEPSIDACIAGAVNDR